MTKKAAGTVAAAVDKYVSGLSLEGAQGPLASLARILAESVEEAPAYARANLARQLRELLTDLAAEARRAAEWAERHAERTRRIAEEQARSAELAEQRAELERMAEQRTQRVQRTGAGVG
jgi:DNA anti-recombination protein RmuC